MDIRDSVIEKGTRSTNQQIIGYYTNGPPLDPIRPHSFSMVDSIVMTDRDQRREGSRMTTFMQFYVEAQGLTVQNVQLIGQGDDTDRWGALPSVTLYENRLAAGVVAWPGLPSSHGHLSSEKPLKFKRTYGAGIV